MTVISNGLDILVGYVGCKTCCFFFDVRLCVLVPEPKCHKVVLDGYWKTFGKHLAGLKVFGFLLLNSSTKF